MEQLHLKNFRKSVDSEIGLSNITMLIGKNNSGKSNVAKSLLLLSDYLESNNLGSLPLNGRNSNYHKIQSYKELKSFYAETGEPIIEITMYGNAVFQIHIQENDNNQDLIVRSVRFTDEGKNTLFNIQCIDYSHYEVEYNIEGIQYFLAKYGKNFNTTSWQRNNLSDPLVHFQNEIQQKQEALKNCTIAADKIRIQTELDALWKKADKLRSTGPNHGQIYNLKNMSTVVEINPQSLSNRSIVDILLYNLPGYWAHNLLDEKISESEIIEINDNQSYDEDIEDEITEDSNLNQKEKLKQVYKEFSNAIGKYVVSHLDFVQFSPVNRYSPVREYIHNYSYSQLNNIDIIKDINEILNPLGELDLKGDEKYFLNKWLIEFGISNGNTDDSLLKVIKYSNLGFSLNVFNKDIETIPANTSGYINLVDKGYGSGQIVAILAKILATQHTQINRKSSKTRIQKTTIILEEPESNLHPNFQTKLIDMLWDAHHQFQQRFVIECHSEYMIRRLQVLVKNKDLKSDEVTINYFDENGVRQIKIEDNGYLNSNFGSGFTDEASNLAMELL